jgi:hypothetical protein
MRVYASAVLLVALLATSAQAADDKLVGKWNSVDQPGKWVELRADGVFRYIYDLTPPPTILEIYWKTGWFGTLTLSMANNGNARDCKYKIDGDDLTIDDGSGKSCMDHIKMAQRFKRAK